MKQNQDQEKFNHIEETAKKLFGRDEDDYLADMDLAEKEWNELQELDKEAADQIRREQKKSLSALQEQLRVRGSKPMTEEVYEQQQRIEQLEQELEALRLEKERAEAERAQSEANRDEQQSFEGKRRRRRGAKKVATLIAVICLFVVGTVIVAVGRRENVMVLYPLLGEDNIIVQQNYPMEIQMDPLLDAYTQIQKELGVHPLMVSYIPKGAVFDSLYIYEDSAQIKFSYGEYNFYLHCRRDIIERNFSDLILSDRKSYQEVFNGWMDQILTVEKNELEAGQIEYSVNINTETESYYVSGIMPEDEFIKITEGLFFEE